MALDNYTFRGVPKPFKHQIETTRFIVENERCFVFNDIGTGKTWSAVWAVDYLRDFDVKNIVIVAPLSTLDIVWRRTFFYLDASLDVQVLKGSAVYKKVLLDRNIGLSGCKISVINPDSLHVIEDAENIDLIIVDESAMFRNAKARR